MTTCDDQYFKDQTILSPHNTNVYSFNKEILHCILGVFQTFWSINLNTIEASIDNHSAYPSKF
jgi:hypothetical protein